MTSSSASSLEPSKITAEFIAQLISELIEPGHDIQPDQVLTESPFALDSVDWVMVSSAIEESTGVFLHVTDDSVTCRILADAIVANLLSGAPTTSPSGRATSPLEAVRPPDQGSGSEVR